MLKLAKLATSACVFIVASLASACATGEDIPFTPEDGGSGGTGLADGQLWCAESVNAVYYDVLGGGPYKIMDENAEPPEGCRCAAWEMHEQLKAKENNGHALVNDWDDSDIVNFRDEVYLDGRADCVSSLPDYPVHDNCAVDKARGIYDQDIADPGFNPTPLHFANEPCTPMPVQDELQSSCPFVDGSYGIAYSSTTNSRKIPRSTWDDFMSSPRCLLLEGGRVVFNESGGYKLTGVEPGSLLDALGLQSDDELREIDGKPLRTIENALAALNALKKNTRWTLKVKRGTGSKSRILSLNYTLD